MFEIITRPGRRMEDLIGLLGQSDRIEGQTAFGLSSIERIQGGYRVELPDPTLPGIRLSFILESDGEILASNAYFDSHLGEPRPLTASERSIAFSRLDEGHGIIDDALATFCAVEGGPDERGDLIQSLVAATIALARERAIQIINPSFIQEVVRANKDISLPEVNRLTSEDLQKVIQQVMQEIRGRVSNLLEEDTGQREAA